MSIQVIIITLDWLNSACRITVSCICKHSYCLGESGLVEQKLFIVSSPNLLVLPNCLHSGYLQIGVKAITEIPSLFLLLFSWSKSTHLRNWTNGLKRVIFWASKHITSSLPAVARNLVLLKNSNRQDYNFLPHFIPSLLLFQERQGERNFLLVCQKIASCKSVETQHIYFVQNIWCRGDLNTIWFTAKDLFPHLWHILLECRSC